MKKYYESQDVVLEGRAESIWDVPGVASDAPSTAKLSLLNAQLIESREDLELSGRVRTASVVTLSEVAVHPGSSGRVHVTAKVRRTWTLQELESAEVGKARSRSMAPAGVVEPDESTISVHVFDRCGNMTIIQAPNPAYEDSTDHGDACGAGAKGGFVEPTQRIASAQPCGGSGGSGGPGSCSAAGLSIYCEVNQKLGRKNWWLLTSIWSTWSRPTQYGDLEPMQRWGLDKFQNYMFAYPQNKKYWNTKFAKKFLSALRSKDGRLELTAASCFRHNLAHAEATTGVSVGGAESSISNDITLIHDQEDKCSKRGEKNVDKNHPSVVHDVASAPQIVAECKTPYLGHCNIDRLTHSMTGVLRAGFSYADTDAETGKKISRKYSVKAQHSFRCDVRRFQTILSVIVLEPVGCAGRPDPLYGGLN
ncbi:hypothetical protein [Nonomuraea sp. NPDC048826]|uniref:hypothetical protein n=1 Tax=Nonomuraea sp. NPDC048826 TaxID=3364347 RepID=UPI00371898F7